MTIIITLFFAEVMVYTFVVRSDSFSFTLANQRWFETYWKPINSMGYRDVEHSAEEWQRKKRIFILGDSFTAGQGIKDFKNRFSNLLQQKLGDDWIVANLAQVGWSTSDQYQALVSHPYRPNILVLAYFVDDIREAANHPSLTQTFNTVPLIKPVPDWIKPAVAHSYLVNFFYWEWYRSHQLEPEAIYWERLQGFYQPEHPAWRIHQQELKNIVDYANEHQIKVIPILFPNLISLDKSQPILTQVAAWLAVLGVKSVNLTSLFTQKSPQELVINQVDAHPNEWVNAIVSERLYELVSTELNQ